MSWQKHGQKRGFGYRQLSGITADLVPCPLCPTAPVARVARRALPPPRPMAKTRSPRRSPRHSGSPRRGRWGAVVGAVRPERADLAVMAARCASAPALVATTPRWARPLVDVQLSDATGSDLVGAAGARPLLGMVPDPRGILLPVRVH